MLVRLSICPRELTAPVDVPVSGRPIAAAVRREGVRGRARLCREDMVAGRVACVLQGRAADGAWRGTVSATDTIGDPCLARHGCDLPALREHREHAQGHQAGRAGPVRLSRSLIASHASRSIVPPPTRILSTSRCLDCIAHFSIGSSDAAELEFRARDISPLRSSASVLGPACSFVLSSARALEPRTSALPRRWPWPRSTRLLGLRAPTRRRPPYLHVRAHRSGARSPSSKSVRGIARRQAAEAMQAPAMACRTRSEPSPRRPSSSSSRGSPTLACDAKRPAALSTPRPCRRCAFALVRPR